MMNNIKHRTETVPGIIRNEIYELNDMIYVESFDDASGKRLFGDITMYGGIKVCSINEDGSIQMTMPTDWVTNHKSMMDLIMDVKRLDEFIATICKQYH